MTRRATYVTIAAVTITAVFMAPATATARPPSAPRDVTASRLASAASTAALTNLAHLDFLTDTVTPPTQPGHTTYRLGHEPAVGVLWVYADHQPDGSYRRTGGGTYDAVTNTYGQGSFDADDISRAAVVYLRQWKSVGDQHSRSEAYELLRGLTYLQTVSGPHAGNVVLWMQPDGTLTPSATPKDTPDPSDSDASYWLARTIWALGEGYAAFRTADPSFAGFLRHRLDLAITALQREVLVRYGRYQLVDGLRLPAWLISDGADASSEAALGLAAYVRAGAGTAARTALSELADGIARMGQGDTQTWPYGALLPWALSRSDWHAWGAQMPSGLAAAATALHRLDLIAPAVADAAGFTPRLLTATGPDNGWLPAPVDGSQIAYGADARVQGLLAVSRVARSAGVRQLAGIAAGWFFGQNPSGQPTYDPATGVTDDGVSADGTVNPNSGAESTIHGLLSMQALDANPDLAVLATLSGHVIRRDGQHTVEAEAGQLTGPATVVHPASAWTGESQWSGGAYLQLDPGSTVTWAIPEATQPELLQAVVNRVPGPAGVSTMFAGSVRLGTVSYGGGGAQGVSAAPGALLPVTVRHPIPAHVLSLTAATNGGSGQLDALLLTPLVSSLVTGGVDHGVALLTSVANTPQRRAVQLGGSGPSIATTYDRNGRLIGFAAGTDSISVTVPAGGFAIALR